MIMKISKYQMVVAYLLASLAAVHGNALADSDSDSGATPLSASANLDFRVVIPAILRFRVGTDGNGSINEIQFDPAVATLGDGTDTSATSGGDIGPGVVTVSLLSNAGQITITENNNSGGSGLSNANGAGADFIPYSEILTVSSDPTNFAAPTLSNAGGGTSTPTPSSGNNKVTSRSETWTYTYDNSTVYPAGDYGTSARGGRVTYTAASP
jgi:hypothetical protein